MVLCFDNTGSLGDRYAFDYKRPSVREDREAICAEVGMLQRSQTTLRTFPAFTAAELYR